MKKHIILLIILIANLAAVSNANATAIVKSKSNITNNRLGQNRLSISGPLETNRAQIFSVFSPCLKDSRNCSMTDKNFVDYLRAEGALGMKVDVL